MVVVGALLFGAYHALIYDERHRLHGFAAALPTSIFYYGDSEETRTDQEAEISVPRRSDGDDDYELYTVTCILTPDEYDHILENRVAVGDCYYVNWYLWEGALFSGLNCRYAERRIWQKARY